MPFPPKTHRTRAAHIERQKEMLGMNKAREQIKAKVTTPINTAVVMAALALTLAVVALLMAVASAH